MESMRQIASAYYERSSEQDKESVEAFFRSLDEDGDGKVSLVELKKGVPWSLISNENMFRQLDKNGDGILDFHEVLAVYYMVNKADLMVCSACYALLYGPYFSCRLCLGNPNGDTFNLCCGCYGCGTVVSHHHPLSCMLDNHSLLAHLRKRKTDAPKSQTTQTKKEMQELREIAMAHYRAGSREVQELAREFYQSMDTNGDGDVELSEFLEFIRHEGYSEMLKPEFFHKLDQDHNGILDFSEVMTLYYIIKSGRPFCNGCKDFIPGMFFSCVECFNPPKNPFNLCHECYRSKKISHSHNGLTQFLDNYTLLEAKRNNSGMQHSTRVSSNERSPIPSNAMVPAPNYPMLPVNNAYMHSSYSLLPYNAQIVPPNHSNAIIVVAPPPVPAADQNKWERCKVALQALEVALLYGSFAAAGCTIL